ncbi:MAG: SMC-Scp complex subunit ScpB [Leucothrix sp.]
MNTSELICVLEAILISAEKPLSIDRMMNYFEPEQKASRANIRSALETLQERCEGRGFELVEVGSGFRYQTRIEYKAWVSKHWDEKPPRYSRALLEILALIMYRQPTTRAEIEEIRGVAVSSNIIKTLTEREWVRVVGHKEVPGRPEMFGTTSQLLDYFNLSSLDALPPLSELKNIDEIYPELAKAVEIEQQQGDESADEALPNKRDEE